MPMTEITTSSSISVYPRRRARGHDCPVMSVLSSRSRSDQFVFRTRPLIEVLGFDGRGFPDGCVLGSADGASWAPGWKGLPAGLFVGIEIDPTPCDEQVSRITARQSRA